MSSEVGAGGRLAGVIRERVRGGSLTDSTLVLLALTAAGAALRFPTLDVQSLWLDETVTANLLDHSLGEMLGKLADSESAPPLYYVLAWSWTQLWGIDEVALRSLSAVLGTAMIPLAGAAAAKLTTQRIGLVTAALVAVDPMLVWFSQEARVYALFAFLSTVSLLAFAAALRDPVPRRIGWWALASAAAIAAHYFGAFLFAPQAVLLVRAATDRRVVYAATAAVAAVAAALVPLALHQRSFGSFWITENPLIERIADTGVQFLVGPAVPAPVAVGPIAALLGLFGVWLCLSRAEGVERRGAATGAIVGVTAIVAPLVLSLAFDVFLQKAMIGAWLPLAVVPAAGYGARRAGWLGLAAAGAACVLAVAVVVATAVTPELQREDWRGAAKSLGRSPHRSVLLVNPLEAAGPGEGKVGIGYYLRDAETTGFRTRTREAALLSHEDSGLDAQIRGVPDLPEIGVPPGFRLAERVETNRYTLLRYQASRQRSITEWARRVREELSAAGRGSTGAVEIPRDAARREPQ